MSKDSKISCLGTWSRSLDKSPLFKKHHYPNLQGLITDQENTVEEMTMKEALQENTAERKGIQKPKFTVLGLWSRILDKSDMFKKYHNKIKKVIRSPPSSEQILSDHIGNLKLPRRSTISFHAGNDALMNFDITMRPNDGFYLGGSFVFTFQVSPFYPNEPPRVKCKTKVYHPNIDLEGNVRLGILREEWQPTRSINEVVHGLDKLFMEPNEELAINLEAAAVLKCDRKKFQSNVLEGMMGRRVGETLFDRCM